MPADRPGIGNGFHQPLPQNPIRREGRPVRAVETADHEFQLDSDLLHLPRTRRSESEKENPGGLDASCAGLILVGFHSKAGTGKLLAHSYEPDILDIRINGISVGEIGVEAAVAGDFGVPLAMITGDSAGIEEAETLVPGVFGVAVKDSLGPLAGCCRPAAVTAKAIAEAARKLAEQGAAAKPWKVDSPVFEITLADTPYGRRYKEMFGPCRIAGKTASECWSIYWNRKLEVFGSLAK